MSASFRLLRRVLNAGGVSLVVSVDEDGAAEVEAFAACNLARSRVSIVKEVVIVGEGSVVDVASERVVDDRARGFGNPDLSQYSALLYTTRGTNGERVSLLFAFWNAVGQTTDRYGWRRRAIENSKGTQNVPTVKALRSEFDCLVVARAQACSSRQMKEQKLRERYTRIGWGL